MAIASIDDYIAQFDPEIQARLRKLRRLIDKNAPGAAETMAYGIPTFRLGRNLVHFAAFPKHIGFYPSPSGITAFKDDLSSFTFAKGSVQFPHDRPLPLKLVARIVRFRVKEEGGWEKGRPGKMKHAISSKRKRDKNKPD
jgi:uncharacterized protein YdhG (YjbR/CyaY superfamily)